MNLFAFWRYLPRNALAVIAIIAIWFIASALSRILAPPLMTFTGENGVTTKIQ